MESGLERHLQTLLVPRVGRFAASCLATSACEVGIINHAKSSLTIFAMDSGRTSFNCKTIQQIESGHTGNHANLEHWCAA